MLAILLLLCSVVARAEVFVTSTPDGGLQPRLVTAADGGVHLLYFKKRLVNMRHFLNLVYTWLNTALTWLNLAKICLSCAKFG